MIKRQIPSRYLLLKEYAFPLCVSRRGITHLLHSKHHSIIKEQDNREDPLEEGIATHSSILAWKIPWTEEPGRLQSMGLQRVRYY